MKIIEFLIILLILGITGLVCLFLCFLVAYKSELWNIVEEKEEGGKDDRE